MRTPASSASHQGHVARKRFGQHFLVDRHFIGRIVDAIAPQAADRIVEIGPGLGALTAPLLERMEHIDAVEVDRDLAQRLRERFAPERIMVHLADALEFDFAALGRGLRVVGNLPYNISTPILFRFEALAALVRDLHFMLQREVVERMAAPPGTRAYGRLSVMLQYRFDVERLFDIPAGAFQPPPKVVSSFVRLAPYASLPWPARDDAMLREVVTAAFGQRRKMLRNAVAPFVSEAELEQLGIDPRARPETLAVADFVRIADRALALRVSR
ncbi:MAG TPA: 16S rRNA (adenine(1518)-N(6)/adenine(1519)-N(6))-dimethyltransferase RsmA [Pelomicrobium sp.]|nr:16S rRNA (adenine(1518)-N(6)/adenine(1519)-N(6))-dimethyltransferase RsmA [Pelomicrobium sp.]